MKRSILVLLAFLLSGALAPLLPCDIHLETAPAAEGGKDKIQVKLFVECIHRRCPLGIEKTRLETEGIAIVKQGPWQKREDGIYQMDLVVSLKGKNKGAIRILRECPKRGLQEETLEIARP